MKPLTLTLINEREENLGTFKAVLFDNKVADTVCSMLPLMYRLVFWGDSLAIDLFPFDMGEYKDTSDIKEGDIVYWVPGGQIQIYYGKTPKSTNHKPGVIGPVIVIGSLTDDCKRFKDCVTSIPRRGSYITIKRD